MKEHIERRSKAAGYKKSILPQFTEHTKALVKGTLDFIGVNLYTAYVAKAGHYHTQSLSFQDCTEVDTYQSSTWPNSTVEFFKVRMYKLIIIYYQYLYSNVL